MARVNTIHMDSTVLLFAGGITVLSGAFAGVISAFSSQNKGISEALQESSRTHSGGKSKARILAAPPRFPCSAKRSEEHTSELQSHLNLVCRLLLEKKKNQHSTCT